jgi:ectoine hydroxylase
MMRIEKILSNSPKVLSESQRDSYFNNGYLVLEKFIDEEWLARIWDTTNEFIEESRSHTKSGSKFDLEPGHSFDNPRLRRLSSPVSHHKTFWDFASKGPIVDVAEDLLGPDIIFHHSKLNFKWSGGGEEVKWHQDIPFYPHTNYSVLAIGLYMHDVDDEMGPMGAIPGSQNGLIYNHYNHKDEWVGAMPDEDAAKLPMNKTSWMSGKAGTITIHHCRVVHGSMPNNSSRPRPLLINAYSSADALPITPHPAPCAEALKLVRGTPARWAEFDSEPCLLPPDWSGGYDSIFAAQQEEEFKGHAS